MREKKSVLHEEERDQEERSDSTVRRDSASHGRGVCVSVRLCVGRAELLCFLCECVYARELVRACLCIPLTSHLGNSLGRWRTNSAKIGSDHSVLPDAGCKRAAD